MSAQKRRNARWVNSSNFIRLLIGFMTFFKAVRVYPVLTNLSNHEAVRYDHLASNKHFVNS